MKKSFFNLNIFFLFSGLIFTFQISFSQNIARQSLDSIIYFGWEPILTEWIPDSKMMFNYDSKGNSFQNIDMKLNKTTNQWVNGFKNEYKFDEDGNLIEQIDFKWDKSKNIWIGSSREEYKYDSKGNNVQACNYYRHDNKWKGLLKIINFYNSDGKILKANSFEWNEQINTWSDEFYTEEYKYDSIGNLIEEIRPSGVITLKFEYTYDDYGYRLQKITYRRDVNNNQWKKNLKNEYIYDSNYNIIKDIYYQWNESDDQWEKNRIDNFIFDDNDNLLEQSGIFYSQLENKWLPIIEKVLNSYDTKGNLTRTISFRRKGRTEELVPIYKDEFEFDDKLYITDFILPYIFLDFLKGNFINQIVEGTSYSWEESTSFWLPSEKVKVYYSERNMTFLNERPEMLFNIYPNPATEYINIENRQNFSDTNISLISITGELITKRIMNEKVTISVSDIPAGLYLLKIDSNDGNTQTKKIIIN
jgi:YD repeat-containing protein